jgi:uncharacterized membrane protein YraQ (UPF0718 family)
MSKQVSAMQTIIDLLGRVLADVRGVVVADWPYLLASVLAAAAVTTYVGTDRLSGWLRRRRWTAITGAVLLATFTPFCSCGTTAVVLGMIAAEAPWAPIVAFMVSSPLTSPSELLLSAGLFGWPFALLYFLGATGLGFAAGGVTGWIEDRGLLVGQARMRTSTGGGVDTRAAIGNASQCGDCGGPSESSGPRPAATRTLVRTEVAVEKLRLRALAIQTWQLGRRIAVYFLAYSAVGYLLIEAMPKGALVDLLGGNALWGVPLAAVLGVPVYITSEASLPMVAALMHGGLGAGAAMAFLVSGAGTSIGAISGALFIARRRVVGLVVGLLLAGAVILGWVATLMLG